MVSGAQQQIPHCTDLGGGFPCTDVSKLNSSQHLTAIRDASVRTGAVFDAIIRYIVNYSALLDGVLLENVMGLCTSPRGSDAHGQRLHSNFEYCIWRLEVECDMWVMGFKLSPKMFGFPIARDRIWMIAIPMCVLRLANISRERLERNAADLMQRLVVGEEALRPLDDFLLNEKDPTIVNFIREGALKFEAKEA